MDRVDTGGATGIGTTHHDAHRRRATLIGGGAILLWSTMAVLVAWTVAVPPFLIMVLTFFPGFLVGVVWSVLRREPLLAHLRLPVAVWVNGVTGLFVNYLAYFLALRWAPPVEANLINYLWPMLIVLFSALLPGERLRWWHVLGGLLGLAGATLIVTRGTGLDLRTEYLAGYLAALVAAVSWGVYSVLSRRFGAIPTGSVAWFCLATTGLALICHLLFETTIWPQGWEWLAVLALGFGPVGGSFFLWDVGMKRGNIQVLGVASYTIPLLSTLFLLLAGNGAWHWTVAAACVLIVGGAVLASRNQLKRKIVPAEKA